MNGDGGARGDHQHAANDHDAAIRERSGDREITVDEEHAVHVVSGGVPSGVDRFFPATFHIFWGGFVLFSLLGNILGGFTGYLTSALMFTAAFLVSFALLRFRRKR